MNGPSNPSNQTTLFDSGSAISSQALEDSLWALPGQGGAVLSGPADSRAKAFRQRDAARGSTTNAAVCGGSGSASSKLAARLGCSLKTRLGSRLVGRTRFSLRWNESATPAGRSWSVLHLSVPPRNENGFGLWQSIPSSLDRAGATSRSGSRKSELLRGGQIREAVRLGLGNSKTNASPAGLLNPDWLLSLMGFPPNWLSPIARPSSPRSATHLTRA